jgi:hypothetical protein
MKQRDSGYTGSNRVNRGGSWNNDPQNCRVANRNNDDPGNRNNNLGLRLANTAPVREGGFLRISTRREALSCRCSCILAPLSGSNKSLAAPFSSSDVKNGAAFYGVALLIYLPVNFLSQYRPD